MALLTLAQGEPRHAAVPVDAAIEIGDPEDDPSDMHPVKLTG